VLTLPEFVSFVNSLVALFLNVLLHNPGKAKKMSLFPALSGGWGKTGKETFFTKNTR
jgi:hypothetical protein